MKRLNSRLNIIVTAGATLEPLDPVRFISNYSTGLFGYEIAKQARRRGHRVILISGRTALAKPPQINSINISTARQLKQELAARFSWCDCLIMTAAVCDFRLKKVANKKIRRNSGKELLLELRRNPDILQSLSRRKGKKMLLGFALESENLKENAQRKLRQKNLDLIVTTQITTNSYPFGQVKLDVLIMDRKGAVQRVRKITKARLSRILLDRIEKTVLK